jgi:isoleucyl-tRNA synthetase
MESNQEKSASAKAAADKGKNIFVGMEDEVLAFWEKNKIFEKSISKDAPHGEYVFYDGPPFATGTPHYGHLVASLMKDVVPRFWTMNGFEVRRKWGWDCHGLPIENIVEKELGTKSKKEIVEDIGVEKFNALCRSKVFSYVDDWEKIIKRLGRWVDMEHPYRTMDIGYMESIWWAFKQLWSSDLIYKDYRSMHVCPRCETTLSQSEVAEGYKDVKDLSVTAKFELVDEPSTFVLAWTTTPWTLPGNVALAVGNDVDYVHVQKLKKVENSEEFADTIIEYEFICSKKYLFDRTRDGGLNQRIGLDTNAGEVIGIFEIKKEFKGSELVGKKYKPVFDYVNELLNSNANPRVLKENNSSGKTDNIYEGQTKLKDNFLEKSYKIWAAEFVKTDEGTGVVHIAPAFGEDDMNLRNEYDLPFIQHVGMDGVISEDLGAEKNSIYRNYIKVNGEIAGDVEKKKKFDEFYNEVKLEGCHVKPINNIQETDVKIVRILALKNLLFFKEQYLHSYPHCWRCDTPLINYATSSWFVKITQMKPRMLELAEGINWSPEHIKAGRFGKWLEGARDWSISRQRFWASVLPIWECNCGAKKVMGSLEEFYQAANGALTKLVFVRHGESESNAANIIYSDNDKYPLTENGRAQISAAAEKLKIDLALQKDKIVFYASPLLRTQESAQIISEALDIKFSTAEELHEINLGDWNDKNRDDLEKNDELRQKYIVAKPEDKMDIPFGGTGETQTQVGERMYNWLLKILPENQGKTILIVSHSDPIDDLISVLRGRNKREAGRSLYSPDYHTHNGEIKTVYLNNATKKEIDLHKDSVDKINLHCDVCGGQMKRVPDVLDTWFDSGSMPYAQMHYPFENKERFENNFPAEFIAEGIDQTRCWFYYLHAISVGIKNNFAYKNVIVNGIVLAEDGKKMSKKLKNYPDPSFLFDKYGADALRYYLLSSPVMLAENLNFSEKAVGDCLRKVNMILWNVYKFYEMYCHPERSVSVVEGPLQADFEMKNVLDKWIIARLNQLVSEVTDGMKKYDLPRATRPIVQFIDDFSTWYVRRSRDRFKDEGEDKNSALAATRLVLTDLAKIMAPFTPFIAEQLWQKVTGNNFANSEMSVHLEEWPSSSFPRRRESSLNSDEVGVLTKMENLRKIIEIGLALRDIDKIKVRQPLNSVTIWDQKFEPEYEILIKDELNVKNVFYKENDKTDFKITLDVSMTPELIAEGMKRELVRFINAERKNADLTINDRITLQISTESEAVKNAVKLFEADLKKDVLADEIIIENFEGGKEVEANGEKLFIKVNKI